MVNLCVPYVRSDDTPDGMRATHATNAPSALMRSCKRVGLRAVRCPQKAASACPTRLRHAKKTCERPYSSSAAPSYILVVSGLNFMNRKITASTAKMMPLIISGAAMPSCGKPTWQAVRK